MLMLMLLLKYRSRKLEPEQEKEECAQKAFEFSAQRSRVAYGSVATTEQ
jgi:hypothetical protein